jgi:hypothetical protein
MEKNMDPTLIISALTAGAGLAATELGKEAVKDSYNGLKQLILNRFKKENNDAGKIAVGTFEAKPENPEEWEETLKKALLATHANRDDAIIEAAQELMRQAKSSQLAMGESVQVGGDVTNLTVVFNPSGSGIPRPDPIKANQNEHSFKPSLLPSNQDNSDTPDKRFEQDIQPPKPQQHTPHPNLRNLPRPGGPLDVNSQVYIKRQADDEVIEELSMPRGLVTVRGPRQSGKTSLMLRIHVNSKTLLKDDTVRSVFIDLQALSKKSFESLENIWQAIVQQICSQLGLLEKQMLFWNDNNSYDHSMNTFLDHYIFDNDVSPLLLCFDDVDRAFKTSIKTEFFSSIRAFYGRSVFDPSWRGVRWLLNTSSEPAFFIEDINQSPFNVGEHIWLRSFTGNEVCQLANCYGFDLSSGLLTRTMKYLGGHPFLTHLFFYRMTQDMQRWKQFCNGATCDKIFLQHLKLYLKRFQKDPRLAEAFKNIIKGKSCRDEKIVRHLEAEGLAKRDDEQNVICACELYAEYFGRTL